MELEAALEFAHRGNVTDDGVWQFAARTVRDAEEIMQNKLGELSPPARGGRRSYSTTSTMPASCFNPRPRAAGDAGQKAGSLW